MATRRKSRPTLHTTDGHLVAQAVDRMTLIAVAAYYRAERRNFAPGFEHEDWLAAEREIEAADNSRS